MKFPVFDLHCDTALALLIAVMLDQNIPLRSFLRSTYFAPVVVPMVASSLIWIWFYDPAVGPFNQILELLGMEKLKWLYHEDTAMLSILFFSIWKGVGYNVILFLSGLQNISDSYLEAARLDGATRWQQVWYITLPGILPTISICLIMDLGAILGTNTDLILNMYNAAIYEKADCIGTYVYRMGLGVEGGSGLPQYSQTSAIGLFSSLINITMLFIANKLSNWLTDTGLW